MIRSGETILEKALTVKLCSRPSSIDRAFRGPEDPDRADRSPPDVRDPDVRELVERIQERSPLMVGDIDEEAALSAVHLVAHGGGISPVRFSECFAD